MQKLFQTFTGNGNGRMAKVYKDADYGEFVVKFYRDDVHQERADYHTDRGDALGTAQRFVDGDPTGMCGGRVIGENSPAPVEVIDAVRAKLVAESQPATGRHMSNEEFAALVQPLVKANIAFDLALPEGTIIRRITWNGGASVAAVYSNGWKSQIDLVASGVVL